MASKEAELKHQIATFVDSPAKFVLYSYPWKQKGTLLEDEHGPDLWQMQVLKDIGHAIRHGWVWNNGTRIECPNGRIWIAVRSGHGVGKSTLMAWLDHWFLSTHPSPQAVTTANTENQLLYKTWRESAKWLNMLINKHWFEWTATRLVCKAAPTTWFSIATPWSEHRSQGFAGTHERYMMIKFDEASEIDDKIWEVTEGAMTESKGLKLWIVFGNPTMNTGRFSECFSKYRDMWITHEVDARTSNRVDQILVKKQIEVYGEDSDFVRVRIKGQEPRAGAMQFIPTDVANKAKGRHLSPMDYIDRPKIMGVDIARYGDDKTIIITRQGLAAYGLIKSAKLGTMECAALIANEIKKRQPDALFLDMGSTGAAVYDILKSWGYDETVTGVWFSYPSDDPAYFNKRSEMIGKTREWLVNGGCYPDDNEMRDDIITPQYEFSSKEQIKIETADEMKKRNKHSPDHLMALALTFAFPVLKKVRRINFGDDKKYNTLNYLNKKPTEEYTHTGYMNADRARQATRGLSN